MWYKIQKRIENLNKFKLESMVELIVDKKTNQFWRVLKVYATMNQHTEAFEIIKFVILFPSSNERNRGQFFLLFFP